MAIIGLVLILIAVKYVSDASPTERYSITRLNIGMFHTTGLLYLIGAALTILFIGLVIVFIAEILQIVAFFSIPEQMPMGPQPMPGQIGAPAPQAQCSAFLKRT